MRAEDGETPKRTPFLIRVWYAILIILFFIGLCFLIVWLIMNYTLATIIVLAAITVILGVLGLASIL